MVASVASDRTITIFYPILKGSKLMTYKTNNYYWDSVANRKPVAPETTAQRADRKQREAAAFAAYVAKYGHSPFKRTK
jgi:hypothetical protein